MNEYYGNNDWRDYLALRHHGILGMEWGKRNGPPYPLGYGDHSAAEKKSNPKGRLDNYEPSSIGRKRRYITKEAKRIEKRYKRDIKKLERTAERAESRYNLASENGPSRRADRLEESYKDALTDSEALKRMRDAELDRLNNMTERDIKNAKKEERQKLRDLEYESDSFLGRLMERRDYKKELAEERGQERLTEGERNQLKERARKQANSDIDKDSSLRERLREYDQKYYDNHMAGNYKEREKYGEKIANLREEYISKSEDKSKAASNFDKINDEVMSQRRKTDSTNTSSNRLNKSTQNPYSKYTHDELANMRPPVNDEKKYRQFMDALSENEGLGKNWSKKNLNEDGSVKPYKDPIKEAGGVLNLKRAIDQGVASKYQEQLFKQAAIKNPYLKLDFEELAEMTPPKVGTDKYEKFMEALAVSQDLDYVNGKFKVRKR